MGLLWFTNRSVTPKKATHEDVLAEAQNGGYQLINAKQLKLIYDKNPNGLLLADTRQAWEYRSGHVKGALNFPMEQGPLYGWAMIWTLLGIFAGRYRSQPDTLCLSSHPYNSFLFRREKQPKPRKSVRSRRMLHRRSLSLTNSLLGLTAALTGGLMGALLQSPFVLTAIAAVMILLATSLFGFWELKLPAGLTQVASKSYTGYSGTLFMGLTLGVVAAPCIGPFVLGLLTWVAGMGSPWLGFIIFFTLSLGLGFPLFFLAIFSGQIEKLPKSGEWILWIRKLMGWVLVGMAAYFIRPIFPKCFGVSILVNCFRKLEA